MKKIIVRIALWNRVLDDYLAAGNFKHDDQGRDLYFQGGAGSQGYILTDKESCKRLHGWRLKLSYLPVILLPLVFLNLWIYIGISVFFLLWPFLVWRDVKVGLQKSQEKMTVRENFDLQIPHISLSFLILWALCCLCWCASEISNEGLKSSIVISYGFTVAAAVLTYEKIKWMRRARKFPKTFLGIFQILVSIAGMYIAFLIWYFLFFTSAVLTNYGPH